MKIACSVTELIGRTPLLELRNYEKDHGLQATLLADVYKRQPWHSGWTPCRRRWGPS